MLSLSPAWMAALVLLAMLAMMMCRIPVAVSIGLSSFIGIICLRGVHTALSIVGSTPFEFAANWHLSAIPMFLLMGGIAHRCGLTSSLFDAARMWLGGIRGGLAIATNFAAALFAAASGSSVATAAAMAKLAVPEMLRYRYEPGLAAATAAAAGTLGSMIPPSIAFIVFGWYTETPISKLFIAGIVPGLLNAALFATFIYVYCTIRPNAAPRPDTKATMQEKIGILAKVWPIPVLILCVVGGIYCGIATTTEAAAVGALAALGIAIIRRAATRAAIIASISDTLHSTASIFMIAIAAILLTKFLAMTGIPPQIGGLVTDLQLGPYGVIAFMVVFLLILGCFLDSIGILLISLPLLMPMWAAVGLDMIWMGVLTVMLLEVGLLTPPVGLNAYVVRAALGNVISLGTIFRGLAWFVAVDIIVLALLIIFPSLSLFLPGLME